MRRKPSPEITFVEFKVLSFGSDEELIASYGSLEAAGGQWALVREVFLQRWNLWGMPQAWWRFEPSVPDDLRTGPALILTEADADEWRSIDLARRRYLASLDIDPTSDRSSPFGDR
jgi:hypothetical protein